MDEVIEKEGDWWFVKLNGKEGWLPSTYLEKKTTTTTNNKFARHTLPSLPPSTTYYIALADFEGKQTGSIPLSEGERVTVVEECDDGWWRIIKLSGEEGWAPAAFLEKQ